MSTMMRSWIASDSKAGGRRTHTGTEAPLAFRFWCASPASGTAATTKASSTPPMTTQAAGEASLKRRAAACALPTTPR
jgi:hypothetical protein